MAVTHLTDAEMQDYLDGNLSQKQVAIFMKHLKTCNSCQNELHEYKNLYTELKSDAEIQLSANFSKSVISKIQQESPTISYARFRDILLSIIGLIIAVGITLYFVDLKPLTKSFSNIINPLVDSAIVIFTNVQNYMSILNIDINLFVVAGLILLVIIAIDHILYRHKDKLFSLLKTLPTFYHF